MARSEREITLDNILSHLDEIHQMRIEAKTIKEIAEFLGLSYNVLYKYISIYTSNSNYKVYYKDLSLRLNNKYNKEINVVLKERIKKENEKVLDDERETFTKISRAWNVDNERKQMVEDALFKSCFDHTIVYRYYDKKTGNSKIAEQPVPASYNAQRFYLINRHPEKWANENKEVIKNEPEKIGAIEVKFIKPNDEPSIKRVNEMMEKIRNDKNPA